MQKSFSHKLLKSARSGKRPKIKVNKRKTNKIVTVFTHEFSLWVFPCYWLPFPPISVHAQEDCWIFQHLTYSKLSTLSSYRIRGPTCQCGRMACATVSHVSERSVWGIIFFPKLSSQETVFCFFRRPRMFSAVTNFLGCTHASHPQFPAFPQEIPWTKVQIWRLREKKSLKFYTKAFTW